MVKRQRETGEEAAASGGVVTAAAGAGGDSDSATAVPPRLTRTQLKNRGKRMRARRPCHRCGRPGHKKSACSQQQQQTGQPAAAQQSEEAEADVQCLGCRSFGHRLQHCPHSAATRTQRQNALSAADALSQQGGQGEGAGGDETRRGATAEEAVGASSEAVDTPPPPPPPPAPAPPCSGRYCYHCGSATHTAAHCAAVQSADRPAGTHTDTDTAAAIRAGGAAGAGQWQYAVCFICGATGHLARHCPSSDHGMFVRGGACHRCGSNQHKAKHCTAAPAMPLPVPLPTQQQATTAAGAAGETAAAEGDEAAAATVFPRLSLQQLGLSHLVKQLRPKARGSAGRQTSSRPRSHATNMGDGAVSEVTRE